MEFVVLGPTKLIDDSTAVPLGAVKQRGMLGMLLLHAGDSVRTDILIDHLWEAPGRGDRRQILYSMASRLRGVLGQVGLHDALVRIPAASAYRLDVDPSFVDLHQFRRLVSAGREHAQRERYDDAVTALERAVKLWRGEPLVELRGARAERLRGRLNDSLLDARKLLAESFLHAGRHLSALAQLEGIAQDHELDDRFARLWMTALCAAGRSDDARRYFAAFRRRFRKAMHAEPATDLASIITPPKRVLPLPAPPAVRRPHQLPTGIKDFIGREDALQELGTLTGGDRAPANVVVLTGMPGVGKTALALHWSHQQSRFFPDGQLYLDAGAYGPSAPVDPHQALANFLEALGVAPDQIPQAPDRRRERFNEMLAGRRMLVVLDNVLDSPQVRPLIPHSGMSLTVVTSRQRLSGLSIRDGIRNVTVEPLTAGDSIALLTHMIGDSRSRAEPHAVDALAETAGGHPLALRVLGERVAERPRASIADIAKELRYRLLESACEDDDQANLTTVFAWSYQALPPDAARLFRRLAQHPGASAGVEVAAALAGVDPRAAEMLLNGLARVHLIDHDTARHYRFHDLLRLYAMTRAIVEDSASDLLNCRRVIYDWYLLSAANAAALLVPELPPVPDLPAAAWTRGATFATEADALSWCDRERENLSAATRSAAQHGFHRHAWQIPGAVYEIFDRTGRHDDLLVLNEIAVAAARRDEHAIGQIGSLTNLGAAHFAKHNYRQAAIAFTAARDFARTTGHIEAETICSHNMASTHLREGETRQAIELYQQALDVCRAISHPAGEAASHHRLGDAYRQDGQHDRSADHYRRALSLREQIGYLRGQGKTHNGLSRLYLETGKTAAAAVHCQLALRIHEQTKDEAARCDALIIMAEIRQAARSAPAAMMNIRSALTIAERIGDSYRKAQALAVLADILIGSGSRREAAQACAMALRISDNLEGSNVPRLRDRLHRLRAASLTDSCAS